MLTLHVVYVCRHYAIIQIPAKYQANSVRMYVCRHNAIIQIPAKYQVNSVRMCV